MMRSFSGDLEKLERGFSGIWARWADHLVWSSEISIVYILKDTDEKLKTTFAYTTSHSAMLKQQAHLTHAEVMGCLMLQNFQELLNESIDISSAGLSHWFHFVNPMQSVKPGSHASVVFACGGPAYGGLVGGGPAYRHKRVCVSASRI